MFFDGHVRFLSAIYNIGVISGY
ncbi:hypothetical protein [Vibrio sp. HA2012]